jgi:hypothetical protein
MNKRQIDHNHHEENFAKIFFPESHIAVAVDRLWKHRLIEDVLVQGYMYLCLP